MNVTLKSFCEDVSLADPKNTKQFLVFEQDGEEFRVPVGRDAVEAIVRHIYKKPQKPLQGFREPIADDSELKEEVNEPEEDTQATVFGGEEPEPEPDSEDLPPDDENDPIGTLELQPVEDDGVASL